MVLLLTFVSGSPLNPRESHEALAFYGSPERQSAAYVGSLDSGEQKPTNKNEIITAIKQRRARIEIGEREIERIG